MNNIYNISCQEDPLGSFYLAMVPGLDANFLAMVPGLNANFLAFKPGTIANGNHFQVLQKNRNYIKIRK